MKLTMNDGTVVEAPEPKPIDVVAFERHFHVAATVLADAEGAHLEHAFFLAWHALKRTGATTLDFDAFLAEIDDFETDTAEAPPTKRKPRTSKS